MARTRLRRRLADAYGIGLPPPPPVLVADYWAVNVGTSGTCTIDHYHGSDFVERVLEVFVEEVTTGTPQPANSCYDPDQRFFYSWQSDYETGARRVYRVDLDAGSFSFWRPEDHLPSGAVVDYEISDLLFSGGSVLWAVVTQGKFPSPLGPDDPYSIHLAMVSGSGSIAGGVVLASADLEWLAGKTTLHTDIGDCWVTNGGLNLMLQEHWDNDLPSEEIVIRSLRLTPGGVVTNTVSALDDHTLHSRAVQHPAGSGVALVSPNPSAGFSSLATRGQGDVAPVALWPAAWGGAGSRLLSTHGSEAVLSGRRGPISGASGPSPTEQVSIIGYDHVGQL